MNILAVWKVKCRKPKIRESERREGRDGFYLPRKRELKTLLFGNEKNYLITILSSFFSAELEIEKISFSVRKETLQPSDINLVNALGSEQPIQTVFYTMY